MAKESKSIKIGNKRISKSSRLYKIIENSAYLKKDTVENFLNRGGLELIQNLQKGFRGNSNLAIDDIIKLIVDAPRKIYVNEKTVSKIDAAYQVERFKNLIKRLDKTVMQILMDYEFDLDGNIYLKLPKIPKYDGRKPTGEPTGKRVKRRI